MTKTMNKLEMIKCAKCGAPMPKLRLTQYGYKFCVKCSTEKPKVARFMTYGTGDHTWNDIQILDQETAAKLVEMDNATSRLKEAIDLEYIDFDNENEAETSQSVKENVDKLLKDDENG